jgi:hypothetical protein
MSLSSKEKSGNPASKFLSWKGGVGVWEYYDKEHNEKVQLDEKLYIVPLDEFSTIKGWHDTSQSGIYSNEVKFLNDEELSVRSFKGGEIIKGLYANIKGNLEGGKFCKSVYAAMLDSNGNVIEMINISFSGSSLGSWIDAKVNIKEGKVLVISKNPEVQKKGATKYYVPSIKVTKKKEEILKECSKMDEELQAYLGGRDKGTQEVPTAKAPQAPVMAAQEEDDSDLPF